MKPPETFSRKPEISSPNPKPPHAPFAWGDCVVFERRREKRDKQPDRSYNPIPLPASLLKGEDLKGDLLLKSDGFETWPRLEGGRVKESPLRFPPLQGEGEGGDGANENEAE